MNRGFRTSLGCTLLLLIGCPMSADKEERSEFERRRTPFPGPQGEHILPDFGNDPTSDDVLRYAFQSNPDLRRAYFEWKSAAPDDPRFSFDHLFSKEMMTKWDRTTLEISRPLEKVGQSALQEAIAARRRFEDAKFKLQADVVEAIQELLWVDASIGVAVENLRLLKEAALDVGAAEIVLEEREAERAPALAKLNALLLRPPAAPLKLRSPAVSAILPPDLARILERAAERHKELDAIAAEFRRNEDALDLARKAYLPDLDLSCDARGSVEKLLASLITLPLQPGRVQSGLCEAEAGIQAARAALRSHQDDLCAQGVLQICIARDSDRQAALIRSTLLPKATSLVDALRRYVVAGNAAPLEWIDAQRSLLELKLEQVRLESTRETAVARLEALCAFDFGAWKD